MSDTELRKVYVENKDLRDYKKAIQKQLGSNYQIEKIISNKILYHGHECRTLFIVKVIKCENDRDGE